ncbi:MAG TPA: HPr family phosphocarrier protein [Agitococcus sp.]|nr:HPr family phosphocarrier protein [Agitococcus sp.]
MIQADIEIINKLGLHARATAKLIALTSTFRCNIKITKGTRTVDGKNMMGVLMLGAGKGTVLQCTFAGEDEEKAHQSVVELFNRRFDEGE